MTDDVDNDPRDDRQAGKEKASAPDALGDGQPDLKAAVDFLDAWHGREPRHLVAIVPDQKATGRSFAADQSEQMADWMRERQHHGANIYHHINQLNGPPRYGKAKKEDVGAVRGAHLESISRTVFPTSTGATTTRSARLSPSLWSG
jgi:hypothetical protein